MRREAKAHADEVEARILEYMKYKDYVSLARYSENYALTHYSFDDDERFGKYYPALVLARDYTNLYADMMPIVTMDDPKQRWRRRLPRRRRRAWILKPVVRLSRF